MKDTFTKNSMNIVRDKFLREVTQSEILQVSFNGKQKLIALIANESPTVVFQYPYLRLLKKISHREKIVAENEEKAAELFEIHSTSPLTHEGDYSLESDLVTIKGPMIEATTIAFSEKGQFLAIGYANGDIMIFDCGTWQKVIDMQFGDSISTLQFMQDDQILFSMTENWEIFLLDTKTWQIKDQKQLEHPNFGTAILSQDMRNLYTIVDHKRVFCFDFQSLKQKQEYKGHKTGINMISLSPDGKMIASCGNDGKISLFSTENGTYLGHLLGHTDEVHSIAFTEDGLFLVSSGEDNNLILWDLSQKKPAKIIPDVLSAFTMQIALNAIVLGNVEGELSTFKII